MKRRHLTCRYGYRALFLLSVLLVLASCDNQGHITKAFVWDEDVKTLTDANLHSWLRKAPFGGEFGKGGSETVVLTNADQVFPFKGRYHNAIEELRYDYMTDTVIYQATEVLFQDSVWGDLFLHATLLYEDQEVFLDQWYTETGSPFFGGVDAVTDSYSASLYETSVFAKHASYKTGIYWAMANYQRYLLGFYQQGQLVFETAIPVIGNDTLATLDKLKEINTSLGLNIPEWESAAVAQLQRVEQPSTFWEDPFVPIYPRFPIEDVFLKLKGTSFTEDRIPRAGDYSFSYSSNGREVSFYIVKQQTDLNEEDFNKKNRKKNNYRYRFSDIFYEEHPKDGYVQGIAEIYCKDNEYLEIHYSYPEHDAAAKQQVHDVLKYVKII